MSHIHVGDKEEEAQEGTIDDGPETSSKLEQDKIFRRLYCNDCSICTFIENEERTSLMLTLISEEDEEEKCKEIPTTNLIFYFYLLKCVSYFRFRKVCTKQ